MTQTQAVVLIKTYENQITKKFVMEVSEFNL